jgi:hypothetical protein
MEAIKDKNGIYVYKISKGSRVFRGDSSVKRRTNYELDDRITFFGLDKENVEHNYGITFEFVVQKPMTLIAIDRNNGNPVFLDRLPEKIQRILNINYGYGEIMKRNSTPRSDNKLSEFIRDNLSEYDGYGCNEMPTDSGGVFHSEIMVCHPAYNIGEGVRITDDGKLSELHAKHLDIVYKPKRKTRRRRSSSSGSKSSRSLRRRSSRSSGSKSSGSKSSGRRSSHSLGRSFMKANLFGDE